MSRFIVALLITLFAAPAFAADKPKTDEQKTLYAIGLSLYRTLSVFNLTPAELAYVKEGLVDAGSGKTPEVDLEAYTGKVQELALARRKAEGEKQAAGYKGFIDKVAKEKKGAVKTDSGMVYLSLKEGSGISPGPADTVKVNYRGTLPDGKEFNNSYESGAPVEIRLDSAIKCWTEGLQKMKTGGKAELVCPQDLAYGDAGAGDLILPGATLVFEVELVEVKK
jgi:FKBP-type peptidyl-prolyl cis-trans isomerase FkpA